MMIIKTLIRGVFSYSVGLLATPYIVTGFSINPTVENILFAAIALTVIHFLVKPIIQFISFPINFVTLGVFGLFIDSLMLFLAAYFIVAISIEPGLLTFNPIGLDLPVIELSWLLTLIAAATSMSIINWILKKALL